MGTSREEQMGEQMNKCEQMVRTNGDVHVFMLLYRPIQPFVCLQTARPA
jgi:hypothetical protein